MFGHPPFVVDLVLEELDMFLTKCLRPGDISEASRVLGNESALSKNRNVFFKFLVAGKFLDIAHELVVWDAFQGVADSKVGRAC